MRQFWVFTTIHTMLLPTKIHLRLTSLPTKPVGPDSPLVHHFWDTNPLARTWLLNLKNADPESYPILPMIMTGHGYAVYDRTASNIYEAYIRTWVAQKRGRDRWFRPQSRLCHLLGTTLLGHRRHSRNLRFAFRDLPK
jgi:hypothetical protein